MSGGAPRDRATLMEVVVVEQETAPGSGVFRVDGRLTAESVEQLSDDRLSKATIVVRLDDGFDALDAQRRYHPDLRLRVRADGLADAAGTCLFDGYPLLQRSRRAGLPQARNSYHIEATSLFTRWAEDEQAQVIGRRMRNGAILDGLQSNPDAFAGASVLVEALPCIFNADGAPNRAADPLIVHDADGVARLIYPFTYEGDVSAATWTLLDALRYLVWFYRPHGSAIAAGAFFDATESAVGLAKEARGVLRESLGWVDRLLSPAADLNCEATSLFEAVALLADQAGVHAWCDVESAVGEFVVRAPEDGVERSAPLVWGGRYADGAPRYDVGSLTARDVVADNRLQAVEVDWDQREVVTTARTVGAVKRWEMTVPLVPGWLPETDLDNVDPGDRESAKGLALTPDAIEFFEGMLESFAWYRKYHRNGSEFADHADVARLWVLNEDGAYDAEYERDGPYDDYAAFDFSQVGDEAVTVLGGWSRRVRPMQRALTLDEVGRSYGIHVEVSFDNGSTWHRPVGAVDVLDDRAGIRFELANPTAMIETGGDWSEQNMWYALIDQTFRVRATAVFDADERLIATSRCGSANAPTIFANSRTLYKPRDYAFDSRQGTTNALFDVNPTGDAAEVDESAIAETAAGRIVSSQRPGLIEAELTFPWIERGVQMGDRLVGVGGRDLAFGGSLVVDRERSAHWVVVGRKYALGTPRRSTRLVLARRVLPEAG